MTNWVESVEEKHKEVLRKLEVRRAVHENARALAERAYRRSQIIWYTYRHRTKSKTLESVVNLFLANEKVLHASGYADRNSKNMRVEVSVIQPPSAVFPESSDMAPELRLQTIPMYQFRISIALLGKEHSAVRKAQLVLNDNGSLTLIADSVPFEISWTELSSELIGSIFEYAATGAKVQQPERPKKPFDIRLFLHKSLMVAVIPSACFTLGLGIFSLFRPTPPNPIEALVTVEVVVFLFAIVAAFSWLGESKTVCKYCGMINTNEVIGQEFNGWRESTHVSGWDSGTPIRDRAGNMVGSIGGGLTTKTTREEVTVPIYECSHCGYRWVNK